MRLELEAAELSDKRGVPAMLLYISLCVLTTDLQLLEIYMKIWN